METFLNYILYPFKKDYQYDGIENGFFPLFKFTVENNSYIFNEKMEPISNLNISPAFIVEIEKERLNPKNIATILEILKDLPNDYFLLCGGYMVNNTLHDIQIGITETLNANETIEQLFKRNCIEEIGINPKNIQYYTFVNNFYVGTCLLENLEPIRNEKLCGLPRIINNKEDKSIKSYVLLYNTLPKLKTILENRSKELLTEDNYVKHSIMEKELDKINTEKKSMRPIIINVMVLQKMLVSIKETSIKCTKRWIEEYY